MFPCQRSLVASALLLALLVVTTSAAQAPSTGADKHDHRLFPCLEDGLKSSEFGCQLLAKLQVPRFPDGPLFWHLNRFPTREAATAASDNGLVVEAEGSFWLYTFGPKNAVPARGEHVASIGPLQLTSNALPAAKSYEVVAYFVVMPARSHTIVHTHPGPEAWYLLEGEQCLEIPTGTIRVRAGEGAVAPPATPMRLTNNGVTTRRALFIVIHDAAQPWSTVIDNWKPTGACDR